MVLLKPLVLLICVILEANPCLDIINKAAITVIPKEPFIRWVQSTDAEAADIPDVSILSYSRMYLVDDSLDDDDDDDDPEKLIKKNFNGIFEEELAGWYTDEEHGPRKWICGYLSSGSM